MSEPQISGVVAVFISPDGRVVAEVTDFERSGYGGFTLEEAQRIRCKRALNRAVVSRFASDPLANAISEYSAESIVSEMVDKGGYRKHFITIGHGQAEGDAP